MYHLCLSVPCCPEGVSVSVVSTDTLEIMWTASRGAQLYQTRAVDGSEVILCNDTAPVCALSDLSCDSSYSVVVTPCSEISGCNHACKAHTKDTGRKLQFICIYYTSIQQIVLQNICSVLKTNETTIVFRETSNNISKLTPSLVIIFTSVPHLLWVDPSKVWTYSVNSVSF